jgi:hypothetical protein
MLLLLLLLFALVAPHVRVESLLYDAQVVFLLPQQFLDVCAAPAGAAAAIISPPAVDT